MIIGISGKSGSGKTYFSNLVNRNHEFKVIHVDKVIHSILDDEEFKKIFVIKYGEIFLKGGKIDRKKLGNYLFSSEKVMNEYNAFIYPWIEQVLDRMIECSEKPIIIDWMQLPITKYFEMCDRKILLISPLEMRMKRVERRDKVSEIYRNKRERFMLEYEDFLFDEVIVNDGLDLQNYADKIISGLPTVGFYAGSFDPFTNGHLEIIRKANMLFDKIIVGIGKNPDKVRHYPDIEMKEVISYSLKREGISATVITYSGLTLKEAKKYRASAFIRGLRNETDYQYEEEIAAYNEEHSGIDTIYLRAGKVGNISSTLIRRKLENGEDIKGLVPDGIYKYIKRKS